MVAKQYYSIHYRITGETGFTGSYPNFFIPASDVFLLNCIITRTLTYRAFVIARYLLLSAFCKPLAGFKTTARVLGTVIVYRLVVSFLSLRYNFELSSHAQRFGREYMLGNSFMASIPNHPFIKRIIDRIKPDTEYSAYCYSDIMQTTGIIMLNEVYEQFRNDYSIGLLPETQVEPFSAQEISDYLNNRNVDIMERYANKTFAIHYHLGIRLTEV